MELFFPGPRCSQHFGDIPRDLGTPSCSSRRQLTHFGAQRVEFAIPEATPAALIQKIVLPASPDCPCSQYCE
jgi:hypothetical protein